MITSAEEQSSPLNLAEAESLMKLSGLLAWLFGFVLVGLLIGVLASWIARRWKPADLIKLCEQCATRVRDHLTRKPVYLRSIGFFVLIASCLTLTIAIVPSQEKPLVAVCDFGQLGQTDGGENDLLVDFLRKALKTHRPIIDLFRRTLQQLDDDEQETQTAKRVQVHLLIWGCIRKSTSQAEIEPHISAYRLLEGLRLRAKEPKVYELSAAQVESLDCLRRVATEIADHVLFCVGHAQYRLGDWECAFETLLRQKELITRDTATQVLIGQCLLRLNDPKYEETELVPRQAIPHLIPII